MNRGKKNIAIVCDYKLSPDRIGGMDRFFIAFDKALKADGHHVDWYFSGFENFSFYDNLNIELSKAVSVETYFLNQKIQDYNTVITHFLALCTSFYKSIKAFHNCKTIAVDHNPRPLNGFSIKKTIKNRIKGLLYSKYIDQFVGVSKYTTTHILKDYGNHLKSKAIVVYNGIDAAIYKKRTAENKGKFIVASHLRQSKGIQDLIKAVSLIPIAKREFLQIDVYGNGPMEDELKTQTSLLDLDQIINYKGSSPHLSSLLKNYSYLLQPTYMECFSLSILESLAANVPVITTQVGGNLEVIRDGDNGWIYNAGNVNDLKEIIESIIVERISVSQSNVAHEICETFNLDKMVSAHLAIV